MISILGLIAFALIIITGGLFLEINRYTIALFIIVVILVNILAKITV